MADATWIIDQTTGELTVEGLSASEATALTADLLARSQPVNCARPVGVPPLDAPGVKSEPLEPTLRVYRVYHNSVVEGPGRRSVAQLSGCLLRCPGFIYSLEWAKYDAAHERHNLRTPSDSRRLVLA